MAEGPRSFRSAAANGAGGAQAGLLQVIEYIVMRSGQIVEQETVFDLRLVIGEAPKP